MKTKTIAAIIVLSLALGSGLGYLRTTAPKLSQRRTLEAERLSKNQELDGARTRINELNARLSELAKQQVDYFNLSELSADPVRQKRLMEAKTVETLDTITGILNQNQVRLTALTPGEQGTGQGAVPSPESVASGASAPPATAATPAASAAPSESPIRLAHKQFSFTTRGQYAQLMDALQQMQTLPKAVSVTSYSILASERGGSPADASQTSRGTGDSGGLLTMTFTVSVTFLLEGASYVAPAKQQAGIVPALWHWLMPPAMAAEESDRPLTRGVDESQYILDLIKQGANARARALEQRDPASAGPVGISVPGEASGGSGVESGAVEGWQSQSLEEARGSARRVRPLRRVLARERVRAARSGMRAPRSMVKRRVYTSQGVRRRSWRHASVAGVDMTRWPRQARWSKRTVAALGVRKRVTSGAFLRAIGHDGEALVIGSSQKIPAVRVVSGARDRIVMHLSGLRGIVCPPVTRIDGAGIRQVVVKPVAGRTGSAWLTIHTDGTVLLFPETGADGQLRVRSVAIAQQQPEAGQMDARAVIEERQVGDSATSAIQSVIREPVGTEEALQRQAPPRLAKPRLYRRAWGAHAVRKDFRPASEARRRRHSRSGSIGRSRANRWPRQWPVTEAHPGMRPVKRQVIVSMPAPVTRGGQIANQSPSATPATPMARPGSVPVGGKTPSVTSKVPVAGMGGSQEARPVVAGSAAPTPASSGGPEHGGRRSLKEYLSTRKRATFPAPARAEDGRLDPFRSIGGADTPASPGGVVTSPKGPGAPVPIPLPWASAIPQLMKPKLGKGPELGAPGGSVPPPLPSVVTGQFKGDFQLKAIMRLGNQPPVAVVIHGGKSYYVSLNQRLPGNVRVKTISARNVVLQSGMQEMVLNLKE